MLRGRLAIRGYAGAGVSIVLLRNELPNGPFPSTPMLDQAGDVNLVQLTLTGATAPPNGAAGATPSRKKLFD